LRCLYRIKASGHSHDDIARSRVQGVPQKPTALWPPGVLQFGLEFFCKQFSNLILKAFLALI